MESFNLQHWTRIGAMNHFLGRARLRRALIFIAPKGFQGSTESRPTFRFMESPLFLTDLLTGHEPELRKPLEINKTIFRFMGRAVPCGTYFLTRKNLFGSVTVLVAGLATPVRSLQVLVTSVDVCKVPPPVQVITTLSPCRTIDVKMGAGEVRLLLMGLPLRFCMPQNQDPVPNSPPSCSRRFPNSPSRYTRLSHRRLQ